MRLLNYPWLHMETIETTIEIGASAEKLFNQLIDVVNNKRWMATVEYAQLIDDGPIAVSSQYEESGRFLGVSVTDTKAVTALEPNRHFAYQGDFASNGVAYTLKPISERQTQLVARLSAEPPALMPQLAKRQIMRQARKQMASDLQRLKQLVESEVATEYR